MWIIPLSLQWGQALADLWARYNGVNPLLLNKGEGEFMLAPGGAKFCRTRANQVILAGYTDVDRQLCEEWLDATSRSISRKLGLPYSLEFRGEWLPTPQFEEPEVVGSITRSRVAWRCHSTPYRRGMGKH